LYEGNLECFDGLNIEV